MNILTFLIVTLLAALLASLVIRYWVVLFFIRQAILIVVGIIASSWITALTLTTLNTFITGQWSGFNTRWLYSSVFFAAGTVVYFCIAINLISYGISFIRNVFKIK